MSFTGLELPFFFALLFVLHWLLPRRAPLQNGLLLVGSYLFYWTWSPRLAWVLVLATVVDYLAAGYIERHRGDAARMRWGLAASLLYNLGQLAYFKYAGFFVDSAAALLHAAGVDAGLPVLRLALPIGLSFFTFQKLAYVIDVYWDRQRACASPLTFATFVAFFPVIVAGPITRAGDLLPQLEAPRRPDNRRFADGAAIFLLGFAKKAYCADLLGRLVDPVFKHPGDFGAAAHWLALVGYAAQVYCDFAGYSEMAIGSGRLLGVELPANFNAPFLSRSPIELWRRWHISLNTWLFDYLYTPLTTSDGFWRGRLDLAFAVVFLASGLWHGASWTFVLWGAIHGLALILHRRWDVYYRGLCRQDRTWVARRRTTAYSLAAWGATMLLFVLSLLPFRAPTMAILVEFGGGLLGAHGGRLLHPDVPRFFSLHLGLCFTAVVAFHVVELGPGPSLRERFFALPPLVRGALYGVVLTFLAIFVPTAGGAFLYGQF